jgi:hypothetical protein
VQSAGPVPTSLRRHVRPNTPIKYGSAVLWELSYPIARAKSHHTNAEMAIKAYLAAADSNVYEDGYEKVAGVLRAFNRGKI